MNPTQALHDLGQSLWLGDITRALLDSGELERYVRELAITGLTSNHGIFEKAVGRSSDCDEHIRRGVAADRPAEELFHDLAIAEASGARPEGR